MRNSIFALFLVLMTAVAGARDLSLTGIIADHTRTPAGHMLYVAFARAWQARGAFPEANLAVQEISSPRGGTTVTVEYRQRTLFESPGLGSRAEPARVATVAASVVERHLAQMSASTFSELGGHDELQ